jgi:4-alpha-glucanotransferase
MTRPAGGEFVESTYVDAFRRRRTVSDAVRAAVIKAMGPFDPAGVDPVRLARAGALVDPPAELILEDGGSLGTVTRIPRHLPPGYHHLRRDTGAQLLLVAPRRARLPVGWSWGWSAQLYAARSRRSWGIGDLADLRALAAWAASTGARWLLLNPLNAPNPGPDPEPSPYYPSTRRFRDPLYLRVEELPGAAATPGLPALAAAATALDADRAIARSRVLALKRAALEALWRARGDDRDAAEMRAFREGAGPALRRWATFCVISERHGPGWQSWPATLRDPSSPAVARVAGESASAIAFHEWVQLQLDRQLATAAGQGVGLINDLPVGFDPGGFDAWDWQPILALDAAIGSPPDRFNPIGQDWGLPPFAPPRLRAAGYAPFIETVRAALRHAGGLRIDHVLGLFRQWWVPRGSSAADGAYVRYPVEELLAVLAIESERAGAIVIGEDLGTVEAGVRGRLRARGILSTRLAFFERRLDRIPHLALASMTTHDLPTLAGVWSGADLAELRRVGIAHDPTAETGLRRRLAELAKLPGDAPVAEVIAASHARLAATPAALVSATLEDGLGVAERPNVPGSVASQRPNWSLALPIAIDDLARQPGPRRLAAVIARGRSERALADDLGDVDPPHRPQDG